MKLSRLVSAYRPFSSFLSENPMAWTMKSRLPHSLPRCSNADAVEAAVFDVTGQNQRGPEPFGKRLHPSPEAFALVGESESCAMFRKLSRYTPGDGMIVRDAHDQAALAMH